MVTPLLLIPPPLPTLSLGHEIDPAHHDVGSSSSSGFGGHSLVELAEGAPQGDRDADGDVMMGAEGIEEGGDVLILDPDAVEHAPGLESTQPPKAGLGFGAIGESSGLATAPSTNPFAGAKSGPFGIHSSSFRLSFLHIPSNHSSTPSTPPFIRFWSFRISGRWWDHCRAFWWVFLAGDRHWSQSDFRVCGNGGGGGRRQSFAHLWIETCAG